MVISEINPRIRYARYLNLDEYSRFSETVPLDARLFYTLTGTGKIKVKNTEYEMAPHALLLINAGVAYQIKTPESEVQYLALNFDYTQGAADRTGPVLPIPPSGFRREMTVDFHTFEDAKELSEVLYIPKIDALQTKLTRILSEQTNRILYYETKSGHLLAECIADCMRYQKMGDTSADMGKPEALLHYIHTYYSQALTNQSIGKIFGYHPNYVGTLLRKTTGMSLHRYIIHVRLMHAASLLENPSCSVGEIAAQCGFCDMAHFSKCFKKHFGISPSGYRKP